MLEGGGTGEEGGRDHLGWRLDRLAVQEKCKSREACDPVQLRQLRRLRRIDLKTSSCD